MYLWLIHLLKFSGIWNTPGEKSGKSWGKIRNFFDLNCEKMVKTADFWKNRKISEKIDLDFFLFESNFWGFSIFRAIFGKIGHLFDFYALTILLSILIYNLLYQYFDIFHCGFFWFLSPLLFPSFFPFLSQILVKKSRNNLYFYF